VLRFYYYYYFLFVVGIDDILDKFHFFSWIAFCPGEGFLFSVRGKLPPMATALELIQKLHRIKILIFYAEICAQIETVREKYEYVKIAMREFGAV